MGNFLYNLILLSLTLLMLPKWLGQRQKYKNSLLARLGLRLPTFKPKKGQRVIWIHAVSMGETKAIVPLFYKLRHEFPDDAIVISTTTETGQVQAKSSMPGADAHFFLPLDFSWVMKRLIKQLNPQLLILCESDFWYHLLYYAKKQRAQLAVVNGKISDRSFSRFSKLSFFAKKLFSLVDLFCVQNAHYLECFASLGVERKKLHVTGNIKLDAPELSTKENLRELLAIPPSDPIIVLGSTHDPEEERLLCSLLPLLEKIPNLHLFLVPRHPERFESVAALLKKKKLNFSRFSAKTSSSIILVDAMGWLQSCYQIADLAIVGGSFVPDIGGHNVYEPILYEVPVLFGPYMEGQPDIARFVLSSKAGKQVELSEVYQTAYEILTNAWIRQEYIQACRTLKASVQGATDRTFTLLRKIIGKRERERERLRREKEFGRFS